MPVPSFDQHGYLPVGVHDCSLAEIKERFGSFQRSDRRRRLFEKLEQFIDEARKTGLVDFILIDGSFATAKAEPNDIDIVITLRTNHDFSSDLSQAGYNLVSKRHVQRRFGFDIVVVREDTIEYDQAVAFFTQVRHNPAFRKGILKVSV